MGHRWAGRTQNKNIERPNENKLGGHVQFERRITPGAYGDANNRPFQDKRNTVRTTLRQKATNGFN